MRNKEVEGELPRRGISWGDKIFIQGDYYATGYCTIPYYHFVNRKYITIVLLTYYSAEHIQGFIMANAIGSNFHRRSSGLAVVIVGLLLHCLVQRTIAFTPPHRGECRFYLDTADTDEVREFLDWS